MRSLGNSSARFHASTFERAMVFASASGRARNLSAHTGANAATTASSDRSFAILLAVLPSVQPPQPKPTAIVATAPMAAPCSRRFSDSPCSIEGTCTVISFARHGSERGYGYPDGFAVELELKTERLGMAYRLVSAYALVRPESEQNSSHRRACIAAQDGKMSFAEITSAFPGGRKCDVHANDVRGLLENKVCI